jgi:S-methylmethionine-dependent homocysteine/selenocysteine methylase
MDGRFMLTDGGLETTLVFDQGMELPCFAAFDLFKDEQGTATLEAYLRTYIDIAQAFETGFVLESPTWRANINWGSQMGYSAEDLDRLNRKAIDLLVRLRDELESPTMPMVISGQLGPRDDGYVATNKMSVEEAQHYHAPQIATFSDSEADMVTVMTMNYVEEALGVAQAAKSAGMPSVIGFTLETDGHLPTGQSLKDAIEQVDAATDSAPAYYLINCAHPTHFDHQLREGGAWTERIRAIRANASRRSHAELDEASELDAGDPTEFGQEHRDLKALLKNLGVIGGCCGTDLRHINEVAKACKPLF